MLRGAKCSSWGAVCDFLSSRDRFLFSGCFLSYSVFNVCRPFCFWLCILVCIFSLYFTQFLVMGVQIFSSNASCCSIILMITWQYVSLMLSHCMFFWLDYFYIPHLVSCILFIFTFIFCPALVIYFSEKDFLVCTCVFLFIYQFSFVCFFY